MMITSRQETKMSDVLDALSDWADAREILEQKIISAYKSGMTMKDIADESNRPHYQSISYVFVRSVLQRRGVQVRSKGPQV